MFSTQNLTGIMKTDFVFMSDLNYLKKCKKQVKKNILRYKPFCSDYFKNF